MMINFFSGLLRLSVSSLTRRQNLQKLSIGISLLLIIATLTLLPKASWADCASGVIDKDTTSICHIKTPTLTIKRGVKLNPSGGALVIDEKQNLSIINNGNITSTGGGAYPENGLLFAGNNVGSLTLQNFGRIYASSLAHNGLIYLNNHFANKIVNGNEDGSLPGIIGSSAKMTPSFPSSGIAITTTGKTDITNNLKSFITGSHTPIDSSLILMNTNSSTRNEITNNTIINNGTIMLFTQDSLAFTGSVIKQKDNEQNHLKKHGSITITNSPHGTIKTMGILGSGVGVIDIVNGSITNEGFIGSNNNYGNVAIYTHGADGKVIITNSGTISSNKGETAAIYFANIKSKNTVILQTGSIINGYIEGNSSSDQELKLQGHGNFLNRFFDLDTLSVEGDSQGWTLGSDLIVGVRGNLDSSYVKTGSFTISKSGSLKTKSLTISDNTSLTIEGSLNSGENFQTRYLIATNNQIKNGVSIVVNGRLGLDGQNTAINLNGADTSKNTIYIGKNAVIYGSINGGNGIDSLYLPESSSAIKPQLTNVISDFDNIYFNDNDQWSLAANISNTHRKIEGAHGLFLGKKNSLTILEGIKILVPQVFLTANSSIYLQKKSSLDNGSKYESLALLTSDGENDGVAITVDGGIIGHRDLKQTILFGDKTPTQSNILTIKNGGTVLGGVKGTANGMDLIKAYDGGSWRTKILGGIDKISFYGQHSLKKDWTINQDITLESSSSKADDKTEFWVNTDNQHLDTQVTLSSKFHIKTGHVFLNGNASFINSGSVDNNGDDSILIDSTSSENGVSITNNGTLGHKGLTTLLQFGDKTYGTHNIFTLGSKGVFYGLLKGGTGLDELVLSGYGTWKNENPVLFDMLTVQQGAGWTIAKDLDFGVDKSSQLHIATSSTLTIAKDTTVSIGKVIMENQTSLTNKGTLVAHPGSEHILINALNASEHGVGIDLSGGTLGDITTKPMVAIWFGDASGNALTLDKKSTVFGSIVGGYKSDTLILKGQGVFDLPIKNFDTINVKSDVGSSWLIQSNIDLRAGNLITNQSSIVLTSGGLEIGKDVTITTSNITLAPKTVLSGSGSLQNASVQNNNGTIVGGHISDTRDATSSIGSLTIGSYTASPRAKSYVVTNIASLKDGTPASGQIISQTGDLDFTNTFFSSEIIPTNNKPLRPGTFTFFKARGKLILPNNIVDGTQWTDFRSAFFTLKFQRDNSTLQGTLSPKSSDSKAIFSIPGLSFNRRQIAHSLSKYYNIINDINGKNSPFSYSNADDVNSVDANTLLNTVLSLKDERAVDNFFEKMSAHIFGALDSAISQTHNRFQNTTLTRLAQDNTCHLHQLCHWIDVGITKNTAKENPKKYIGNEYHTDFGTQGSIFYKPMLGLKLGIVAGYDVNKVDISGIAQKAHFRSLEGGLFFHYQTRYIPSFLVRISDNINSGYISGLVSYMHTKYNTERTISVNDTQKSVLSSHGNANGIFVSSEVGFNTTLYKNTNLSPYLRLNVGVENKSSADEGLGQKLLAMKVQARTTKSAKTTLGIKGHADFSLSTAQRGNHLMGLDVGIGWAHEWLKKDRPVTYNFLPNQNDGTISDEYRYYSSKGESDALVYNLGVSLGVSDHTSIRVGYDGRLGWGRHYAQSFSAGIDVSW